MNDAIRWILIGLASILVAWVIVHLSFHGLPKRRSARRRHDADVERRPGNPAPFGDDANLRQRLLDRLEIESLRGPDSAGPGGLDDQSDGEAPMVRTPRGVGRLRLPAFALAPALLDARRRSYAHAISQRLPATIALCPKVRLENLLTPLKPDETPDDWASWRRRLRMRAVDFVLCSLPEWTPILAIEIDRAGGSARPFARDRMAEEILTGAGLPYIRCTGSPADDWRMIEPYIREQAGADTRAAGTAHPAPDGQNPT